MWDIGFHSSASSRLDIPLYPQEIVDWDLGEDLSSFQEPSIHTTQLVML